MPPTYLVMDIETVPDAEVHTPPEPPPGTERAFPPLYACKPVVLGVIWLDDCLAHVAEAAFRFQRARMLVGQLARAAFPRAAEALLATVSAEPRLARLVSGIDRARLLLEG